MAQTGSITMKSAQGKGVLFATVLGSGVTFLDGFIVNVALPSMDSDLDLGISGMQWTVSGYLLAISALLLLGGSLGDLYGRRRIYLSGLVLFMAASVACGLAPTRELVIIARVVQGVAGALMVPASLAILQAVFRPEDRGGAIGAWTGLGAIFTGLGPFVGGLFVTYISWRWAFFINVPLGLLSYWATVRFVPENRDDNAVGKSADVPGAALAALGLGGCIYWAINGPVPGSGAPPVVIGLVGFGLCVAFVLFEKRAANPMMPLSLFRSGEFNWINICTVIFYGAFVTGVTFLQVRLQTALGYSPLEAALASFPVTILLSTLSRYFGALGQRIGPRWPMTFGPLLVAGSLFLMGEIAGGSDYWTYVLPVIVLWGIGLAMVVAPLTSAALAAADQRHIGVASALNNAASRVGQALAIALLPALAGMGAGGSLGGPEFQGGYGKAMQLCAVLSVVSALIALVFVRQQAAVAISTQED